MFELSYSTEVVKCVNKSCGANINISVGRVPGGVNDPGGWILQCERCKTKFPYPVKNPFDYSSVKSGAEILDKWDDEAGDKEAVWGKWGLKDFAEDYAYDNLLFVQTGEYEPLTFDEISENIYFCAVCDHHLEPLAYAGLREKLDVINAQIGSYLDVYAKGRSGSPSAVICVTHGVCQCGDKKQYIFYKEFIERELPVKDEYELYLIDATGSDLSKAIDGIYTRDNCLVILQKLLIRWQVFYNKVFLAVPFIGFEFKNSESQRVDLWNWILRYTKPHKTELLTRKATFNSFLQAAKNKGMGIDVLKDYGLLNPTLKELSEKKALFKRDFHAKYYAGFDRQSAEVLAGSFNIHEGSYYENLHYKRYDLGTFFRRYVLDMGIGFDPRIIDEQGEFLFIREKEINKFSVSVEQYKNSVKQKLDSLLADNTALPVNHMK